MVRKVKSKVAHSVLVGLLSYASFLSGVNAEESRNESKLSRENLSRAMLMDMNAYRKGDVKRMWRIKKHTEEMAENYPWDDSIYFYTTSVFYSEPDFRDGIIEKLEEKVLSTNNKNDKGRILRNLASIYRQKAFPFFS